MQKNEIPLPVKHCNFPSFFIKAHNNLNQFAFPQVVKKNLDSIVKAVGDWLKWTRLLLKSKYQLNLNYPLKKKTYVVTKLKYLRANRLDPGKNLTSQPVTIKGNF